MTDENAPDPERRGLGSALIGMVRNGLAVLAAILIAFALDAWWTDRDERQRTGDILYAMVAEFEVAGVQLDSIAEQNQRMVEHSAAFVRRTKRTCYWQPS